LHSPARFGVVALDEGIDTDERPPAVLLERLAFQLELTTVAMGDVGAAPYTRADVTAARRRLPDIVVPEAILEALCTVTLALGIDSLRAALLAVKVARAAAALAGRDTDTVSAADAALAARLVLAARATRLPAGEPSAEGEQHEEPPSEPDDSAHDDSEQPVPEDLDRPLEEMILQAAQAAIPSGLLALLQQSPRGRARAPSGGRAGALQASTRRGRPVGVRRGELRAGARLNVVETLRAAAPWQPLRRRESARRQADPRTARVEVRHDDFRITRFKQNTHTTTIFVVDASGSAALNRLAEAKGAVELLLADCYVRRDQVALLAFRGRSAELLLPPTRSLVRAKRSLANLPGGGGTPLAAGIDAAVALADAIRRRGDIPVIVLLTDGRANVARDGNGGRNQAAQDALAAARLLDAGGFSALLVDTSPRPQAQAQELAHAMGARYLPLPYADAAVLSRAVQAGAA
jgi:magnesium chelatase subunit D